MERERAADRDAHSATQSNDTANSQRLARELGQLIGKSLAEQPPKNKISGFALICCQKLLHKLPTLPIFVPRDADAEALERARREAEDQLNAITREADRLCGWPEMTPAAVGPRESGEIIENASGRAAAAGGGQ